MYLCIHVVWFSIRSRLASTYPGTARNGKASRRPSGQPSWRRPRSFRAQLGGETALRSRSCCRRAAQPGDPWLSRDNRRRKGGRPTGGRRGRRSGQQGLGVGRQGTRGAARTVEGGVVMGVRLSLYSTGLTRFLLKFGNRRALFPTLNILSVACCTTIRRLFQFVNCSIPTEHLAVVCICGRDAVNVLDNRSQCPHHAGGDYGTCTITACGLLQTADLMVQRARVGFKNSTRCLEPDNIFFCFSIVYSTIPDHIYMSILTTSADGLPQSRQVEASHSLTTRRWVTN